MADEYFEADNQEYYDKDDDDTVDYHEILPDDMIEEEVVMKPGTKIVLNTGVYLVDVPEGHRGIVELQKIEDGEDG